MQWGLQPECSQVGHWIKRGKVLSCRTDKHYWASALVAETAKKIQNLFNLSIENFHQYVVSPQIEKIRSPRHKVVEIQRPREKQPTKKTQDESDL